LKIQFSFPGKTHKFKKMVTAIDNFVNGLWHKELEVCEWNEMPTAKNAVPEMREPAEYEGSSWSFTYYI
jgi:hypothetical protein